MSEQLKSNIEIAKIALNENGDLIRYASQNIQNDKEIVKLAIKNNPCC